MKAVAPVKIIIVDDHPMVLEGMKSLLSGMSMFTVQATASNAYEAMECLKQFEADIVLLDIGLPEINGIELTAKIKKEYPGLKILAMSTFQERSYISSAILNGASGYLFKNASREQIEEAILTVYEGKLFLSLDIEANAYKREIHFMPPILTRREKEVLELIATGMTNPQIAEKLILSLHTVDSHRKNLLTKFNVNNTAALINAAARLHLLK